MSLSGNSAAIAMGLSEVGLLYDSIEEPVCSVSRVERAFRFLQPCPRPSPLVGVGGGGEGAAGVRSKDLQREAGSAGGLGKGGDAGEPRA